ncbi:N-acetylglucosamine kinase [Anaerosalibacter massiliensis]|uniref:ATPase BadF/BadG/BcrA/BcrD type domain-containing protein n=1 Tax=Anaerosalibacter massiliensis TaxID=1347392 RepID=A0A9X2S790_9FIRM|nr:BadF/BadG/BcrA/BcrD ATPase family protein [Anaerosalibacter massiliensis]MCR2044507.1 hypothetical protein [Anaerosalibacter massiliensis]
MYIIGIDGGGTKTIGYLSDYNGNILAAAKSDTSNYLSAGIEKAKESLDNVIKSLCSYDNITKDDIGLISLGLAGAGRKRDREVIETILKDLGINCKKIINNDAYIALVGAHGKSQGVITISGTGSITLGLNKKREMFRTGGWGHILGDEGSGYYFGKEGLVAVMKSYDGREKGTLITNKVLNYLNFTTVDEIVQYVYSNINNKTKISGLSRLVIEAAEENDEVARKIINKGVHELVSMIITVVDKMGEPENIALTGGIFDNSNLIKDKVNIILEEKFQLNVVDRKYSSVIGALIIGWENEGVKYNELKLLNQIKEVDIHD